MLKKIAFVAAALAATTSALAQSWPSKPVRLVVPYAAGGPTDVIARKIGAVITAKHGQPVIIDNKGGAGGTIGVDSVLKAPADGYTLALVAPGPVAGMFAISKVNYQQSQIGFISLVARNPAVIAVNSKSGIKTLGELVKTAKAEPGKLNFSSAGLGTTPHIGSELFKQEAQLDVVHVAYKGTAPAVTALISGEVQFISTDLMAVLPFAQQGQLKILAISSTKRAAQVPDVPTTGELGYPNVVMETNYGVLGPKDLPAGLQKRIRDVLSEAVNSAEVKELLAQMGAVPVISSSEEYRSLMQSEFETWKKVAAKGNIRLD
ncbi:Bug family tripartite tricarboxylate transporter substrate binding protein [Hydrogenophaga sp. BPS33]|uniref:Bug family tripartite tricarboxylate transporter substrate binding protein n=1 Tax=Hydrogenophaga sp. BPS33 TaxID=2651974 RepID=UPI00131FD95D|nr:tripartite tricarboxylate transporter substrate binding protein [Hydrogenophaga sp. BPS33]QHE85238.1 tripartite tricarboxylate transporter substrate binding protein [Hydrogenophaga sp. BPS33]